MVAPAAANDVADACHEFATAEVIFVGRVKSAPITRRVSGEQEIEKARAIRDATERDLKAFEALKMPPEIGWRRHQDLAIQAATAREEYDKTRAMHPPPVDLSLTPILVEVPFRGVNTAELFMMNRGQPGLDPARSYLFYAERPLGPLAPDVIFAGQPKDLEFAEADLRFLHEAVADNSGTTVRGSLMIEDLNDPRPMPLGGVVLRISLDGQRYETSTHADGTFGITGVPPGRLTIDPLLPDHLALPPQPRGGESRGGCLTVHLRARVNGRVRGRVLLDTGAGFRGAVDLVPDDPSHQPVMPSPTFTNDRGEFEFSVVAPGTYLLGVNISRPPPAGAAFRPTYFPGTTDLSQAARIVVGPGDNPDVDLVVSDRLREGTIEVTFDTYGQPQKDMGVCVTMYDSEDRASGGGGYEHRSGEHVVIPIIEGIKYRLVAHARTPTGLARSEDFDVIGAPGHRSIRLPVASVRERLTGHPCTVANPKPFSPSR